MDDSKDIQKADILSKFIDGQVIRTNPFGDNRVGERTYRRAERVVAGLHLLTAHLPVHEPLRERVRKECLELLARTLALRDEMRTIESASVGSFQVSIRYLISLVRMLTAGGFVSFQNADVVIAALDDLGNFIGASQRTALAESISFAREDFAGPIGPLVPERRPVLKDIRDKDIIKDTGHITDSSLSVIKAASVQSAQARPRSQTILDILKAGTDFSIRDICAQAPDYSEKMIQRELLSLVYAGKIKKTGSKRWSRYSLV